MNNSFSLINKNIILTGAAGILGQKLSQAYLNAGANLALLDFNEDALNTLRNELCSNNKSNFITYKVDLTKENEVNNTINAIANEFKSIDVLHNNAATKGKSIEEFLKPFEDYKLSTWNDVMNGNLTSMFLMAQAVGKIMKKQKYGNIIQTASIYGVITPDKNIYKGSNYNNLEISSPAAYSVSKNAVIALTKYLASYWGEHNIRVNSISPGGIYSGQNETFVSNYSNKVPLGRMAKENDVLGLAVFLASDASSYITGQNIVVDGGLSL
jgi:NAD(P)-dependent dehydrogenase (short-subunit alcohol dehydrogenase family)